MTCIPTGRSRRAVLACVACALVAVFTVAPPRARAGDEKPKKSTGTAEKGEAPRSKAPKSAEKGKQKGGESKKDAKDASYKFQWEFWAKVTDEFDDLVKRPVAKRMKAPPETPVYMRIQLTGTCHMYVIARNAKNELEVLYPNADTVQPEKGVRTLLHKHSKLDKKPGRRRWYVFASPTPLVGLAKAITAYREAGVGSRKAHMEALKKEIGALRKKHESLETATSKPASIGGTVRGSGKTALEIAAEGVYCRTYTIDIDG